MTIKLNDAQLDLVCGGGFKDVTDIAVNPPKPAGPGAPPESKLDVGPGIPPETLPSFDADDMARL